MQNIIASQRGFEPCAYWVEDNGTPTGNRHPVTGEPEYCYLTVDADSQIPGVPVYRWENLTKCANCR